MDIDEDKMPERHPDSRMFLCAEQIEEGADLVGSVELGAEKMRGRGRRRAKRMLGAKAIGVASASRGAWVSASLTIASAASNAPCRINSRARESEPDAPMSVPALIP